MKALPMTLFLFAALYTHTFGQIVEPVTWKFYAKKISSNTFEIHLSATIDKGWHIYSQHLAKGGPSPTTIAFEKKPVILSVGEPKEIGKLEKKRVKVFNNMEVSYYATKVDFVQVVKVSSNKPQELSGTVEYMACDEKKCLAPTEEAFTLSLP